MSVIFKQDAPLLVNDFSEVTKKIECTRHLSNYRRLKTVFINIILVFHLSISFLTFYIIQQFMSQQTIQRSFKF